ncbi:uncharacterized protein JCM10292_001514 [Rhodotorula paludigena]|uniref:uncharacterized protein n=1 Tax=Rhodotorula paludigena TaxID=86838 RepID=UPI00317E143D
MGARHDDEKALLSESDSGTAVVTTEDATGKAVARGKAAAWGSAGATLLGLVLAGVGIANFLRDDTSRFKAAFIVSTVGWAVQLILEFVVLNELHSTRKYRHPKIVLCYALACCGWFVGYVITSGILFGVWWSGSEFSGSNRGSLGAGLLIGQLIVALVNSAALILYLVRYAIPVYHLEPHGEDATQMKTPLRPFTSQLEALDIVTRFG